MMHHNDKVEPNFYIINGTCPNLARTIPEQICDERRPEDLDTTLEDHCVDALRYALTHIQAPSEVKVEKLTADQRKYKELTAEPQRGSFTMNFN